MNFKRDEQFPIKYYINLKTNPRHDMDGKASTSSTALAAVAFQDHLMRNLSLTDPLKKPVHHGRSPRKALKEVKPVVDTGMKHRKREDTALIQKTEEEFVLEKKPQPLTLAQKLGLMGAPEQRLSDLDWRDAKDKSNRRDDSVLPCVICKEEFGLQQQVLLSCSHVFHRNCLQAFERFTGKKTCPMCRKKQYQTRVIYEGAKLHRVKCAIRIQACWRGYVVRSWYLKLRQTVPPKDPLLRKRFYEEKLQLITERLLRSYDTKVDAFLDEIDRSIMASRDVFKHLEASNLRTISQDEWDAIQLKAVERGKTECPICIMPLRHLENVNPQNTDLHSSEHNENTRNTSKAPHGKKCTDRDSCMHASNSKHTKSAVHKGQTRPKDTVGTRTSQVSSTSTTGMDGGDTRGDRDCHRHSHRHTVLLSCTHVFHQACLEAFEELSLANIKTCPVCRSGYQKKVMPSC